LRSALNESRVLRPFHEEIDECTYARHQMAVLRINHPDRRAFNLETREHRFQITVVQSRGGHVARNLDQRSAGPGRFDQSLCVIEYEVSRYADAESLSVPVELPFLSAAGTGTTNGMQL